MIINIQNEDSSLAFFDSNGLGTRVKVEEDDLVIYSRSNIIDQQGNVVGKGDMPIWSAKKHTHDFTQNQLKAENGARVAVQNDSNVVVYNSDGYSVWAANSPVSWDFVQNIESGAASVTPTATNTTKTVWVSFTRTFTEIPHVVVTPQTSAPNVCYAAVTNITRSGFNINFLRTDSTTETQIHWIAMA